MARGAFDGDTTGLLVVDPCNDLVSEYGKIRPRLKAVAEASNCVPNMHQALTAARGANLQVFYAVHHR